MLYSRGAIIVLLFLVVGSQTGCLSVATLMGQKRSPRLDTSYLKAAGYSIPPGGMPAPVTPTAADGRAVILEVRGDERPHIEQIRMDTERPMFIEDIVRDAKLNEHVGAMRISVMRPVGAGGPPMRMDVQVNDSGKCPKVEQNYALMPGDHLIVNPDSRTSLELFVDKFVRGK